MIFLILGLGAGILAVGWMLGSGKADKAVRRRLDALKERHSSREQVESQLRRIAAQRGGGRLEEGLGRLVPRPELLQRRLDATGRSWTLGQYAVVSAALTLTVWFLFMLRGAAPMVTFFSGLAIGVGVPHHVVGRIGNRRANKFIAHFPDAIELLVRGLRSGLPISETIGVVAREVPEPVGQEFRTVADKMRIGRPMEAALQDTADRLRTAEFQFFVIALSIQRETGGNLAETLANLSDVLRKRIQMKLKIRAMSSESKASAMIIGALPFIVFALIWFVNPSYMGGFFHDQRLIYAAMGAGVWMSIGVFIMAKMINFEM
jgi:tight adherence protein B